MDTPLCLPPSSSSPPVEEPEAYPPTWLPVSPIYRRLKLNYKFQRALLGRVYELKVRIARQKSLAPVALLSPVCARVLEPLGGLSRLAINGHFGPLRYCTLRRARDPPLLHGNADGIRLGAVRVVAVLPRNRLARLHALFGLADLDARRYDGPLAGDEERDDDGGCLHAVGVSVDLGLRGLGLRRLVAVLSRVLFVSLAGNGGGGCGKVEKGGRRDLHILVGHSRCLGSVNFLEPVAAVKVGILEVGRHGLNGDICAEAGEHAEGRKEEEEEEG